MNQAPAIQKKNLYPDTMHALCPYFAMFPPDFARSAIKKYSQPGDLVADPFSGRGTTLLEARILKRKAIANDINPVAVAITKAKSSTINLASGLKKIEALRNEYNKINKSQLKNEVKQLPVFFGFAFHEETLPQILWLRKRLKNIRTIELIFIKTLCLSYLHGETQKTKLVYFSNNLPHTYCPKPEYSIRFWKEKKMIAPKIDVFDILADRCKFRLENSKQHLIKDNGLSLLGDARNFGSNLKKLTKEKIKLVVTSPPYIGITSYEEDQWLRLWFLGGSPYPSRGKITKDDLISSETRYINFLSKCWKSIGKVMASNGIVVCRLGQSAKDHFPLKKIMQQSILKGGDKFQIIKVKFSPFKKNRQAVMFGSKAIKKSGEYDFVLKFRNAS